MHYSAKPDSTHFQLPIPFNIRRLQQTINSKHFRLHKQFVMQLHVCSFRDTISWNCDTTSTTTTVTTARIDPSPNIVVCHWQAVRGAHRTRRYAETVKSTNIQKLEVCSTGSIDQEVRISQSRICRPAISINIRSREITATCIFYLIRSRQMNV